MFMPTYRPCPDLTDPEVPADTAEMRDEEAAIARSERHGAVLARLTDIGMELAEALIVQAKKTPTADLAAAYAKIAQTVRRTIALEAHLAEGLSVRRASLRAKRQAQRDKAASDHEEARRDAIAENLSGAIRAWFPDDDGETHFARLADAEVLLEEADELDGYLDRPIGEVIAGLCRALGLDPDWAVQQEGEWVTKRFNFVPDLDCHWPDAPILREIDPAPA